MYRVDIENRDVAWRIGKLIRMRDFGRNSSVRRWTDIAIDCYSRGCVCQGCFYKNFFKDSPQKCQMKSTVLELVRIIGVPQTNKHPAQILDDSKVAVR